MGANQAAKLAYQLILLTNTLLYPVVNQKLTLNSKGTMGKAVRGWLTGQN